jgi:hypothetical protein
MMMPADDGFRLDHDQRGTPTRPHARQPNPQASIAAIEGRSSWFLVSLQHRQLMAQCDDLGLHSSLAAKPDKKGIQHHYYNVEHGRKRLTGHGPQLQQS